MFYFVVSYFTVINFEFIFDAVVCGSVNTELALQSISENIAANAVSCDGILSDCISYDSFVEITSEFIGMYCL